MTHVIAAHNRKGGVGKTTTAVCLGGALAEHDQAVTLIDLDPQADASAWLGADHAYVTPIARVLCGQADVRSAVEQTSVDGLNILPSSQSLDTMGDPSRSLDTVINDLDSGLVIVDCPPSYSPEIPYSIMGVESADTVIVPLTPSILEMHGLERTRDNVEASLGEGRGDWYALLSRVDYRASISEEVEDTLKRSLPTHRCPVTIGENATIRDAPRSGLPITHYDTSSRGAKDFRDLATWILEEVI